MVAEMQLYVQLPAFFYPFFFAFLIQLICLFDMYLHLLFQETVCHMFETVLNITWPFSSAKDNSVVIVSNI